MLSVIDLGIWMSAINPASFASPSLGLHPPRMDGPGAVSTTINPQFAGGLTSDRRVPQDASGYNGLSQTFRGYQGGYGNQMASNQDNGASPLAAFPAGQYPNFNYGSFGQPPRASPAAVTDYPLPMQQQVDTLPVYATNGFRGFSGRYSTLPNTNIDHDTGQLGRQQASQQNTNEGLMNQFQGLSLGSQ